MVTPHRNISKIESRQRWFRKRIKGLAYMRYPEHLAFLGLETLQARRLKCDLQMCYIVIHNQISILNDDFLVFADCTRGHCYKLYKGYSQVNTHRVSVGIFARSDIFATPNFVLF